MPTSAALDRWGRLPVFQRKLQREAALVLQTAPVDNLKETVTRTDCLYYHLSFMLKMQPPALGTWHFAEPAEKCCRVAHKKGQEFFETPTGELSEGCRSRINI